MANRDLPVVQRILDRLKARYPNITRDQVIHYLSEARAKYYSGKLVGQQINNLVQVIFQLIEDDLQGAPMANRDLPVVQRILDRLKARYPNITRDQVIHYLSEARAKYYSGKLVGQQINNLVQVIFQLIEDDLQGAPMANRDLPVLQRILDRLKARYPNITRDQVIHYLSEARAKYYSGKLVGQQINKLVQVIFQLIEDDLQGVHAPCQETGTAAALDWDSLNMWAEFRAYLRR